MSMSDSESSPNFNENSSPLKSSLRQSLKKRNNIIVLVAMFTLITGSIFSITLQQSKQDEPSYVIINESGANETFTGTYNQTRANLSIKDNGGFFLNFINGTNNPIRIIQHTISGLTGANITINDTTGGSGGLTGSGSNKQVAFWTNSTNLSGDTNLLWNSTNDRLTVWSGAGVQSGSSTLTLGLGSLALPIGITTGNITLGETSVVRLCDATSNNITINLPDSTSVSNRIYIIKKIDSSTNTCIIDPTGSQLIDGKSTLTLSTENQSIIIQAFAISDGDWHILSDITIRESLVGHWLKERAFTNIGTAFVDICNSANCANNPVSIDTTGKTFVRLDVQWDKIGTGTQTVQLVQCTTSACTANGTVLVSLNVVSGNNDSGLVSIPSGLLNSVNWYELQAKSTVAGDDPAFRGASVTIK
jgi:hypothetical protein